MQTVLEVLNKTRDFFEGKGIEKARLEAELLLAHGLNCKRLDLYLRFEEVLSENVLNDLRQLVKRRAAREPLQYVLGEGAFMDLMLTVGPGVLVPRPETEELVSRLLEKWKAGGAPKRVLDLGTGSGAIAIAIAHYLKDVEVVAVDKSKEALVIAKANAEHCGVGERVNFIESDWFNGVKGQFDFIIANPPYLTEAEWESAQPEVKDYEPKGALVAADEGLKDLEYILREGKQYLTEGGGVALETGIAQHEKLLEVARDAGYRNAESWKDLTGRARYVVVSL